MKTNPVKNEKGYTLLEIVVSLVIIGILGTIVVSVIANQSETFNQVLGQTVGLANSRKAVRMLRKDIQNLAVANINTMNGDHFGFVDNDGNNINYTKSGSAFTRNDNVILNGLNQNPFKYLDIDQNVTAVEDSVKFIGVTLSIVKNNESVIVEEIIYARN